MPLTEDFPHAVQSKQIVCMCRRRRRRLLGAPVLHKFVNISLDGGWMDKRGWNLRRHLVLTSRTCQSKYLPYFPKSVCESVVCDRQTNNIMGDLTKWPLNCGDTFSPYDLCVIIGL